MYMCGGKMKYDLGGMMMPGVGGSISAGGDLIGSTVDAFAMKNNDKPYTKKSVASGALKGAAKGASTGMAFGPWGAAIGGVVGGAAGALSTKFGNDASQQAFQQQQQEAIKQQLISNLPAQPNYIPTFAMGGDITDRIADISNGQTHEQSAIGGVPMGQNALAEVGEVVFKNKAGKKYVFTNRF